MLNYEAWDVNEDICIYSGSSKKAMDNEVNDYLEYTNGVSIENIKYYVNGAV